MHAIESEFDSLLSSTNRARRLRQGNAAIALAATLVGASAAALFYNTLQGPVILPFISMAASVWIVFELFTAFLLLSLFVVTGFVPFALFGAAYGITGSLTIPYLFLFPHLFSMSSKLASEQTSAWLWLTWHLVFALVAMIYAFNDRRLSVRYAARAIGRTLRVTIGVTISIALLLCGLLVFHQGALPQVIADGHFTRTFAVGADIIAALSAIAVARMFLAHRRHTLLDVWIMVAVLSQGLDALLNAHTPGRYTIGWYVGKFETTVTASVVFLVLLLDIVTLYRRADAQRLASLDLNTLLEQDLVARIRAEAALRTSDELLRQVESHTPIGLAVSSVSGQFIRVNPALCALTGYSPHELLALDREHLTHPDDLGQTRERTRALIDGNIETYSLERRSLHKHGDVIWTFVSCSIVRGDGSEILYIIEQLQDIGARKEAEQAFAAAQAMRIAATEAKSRFLATMSHEIRTPMNGIIGMTELLSLSPLSHEQNEYVNIVRDSGHSLLRVVNDILDYSKVEAGKLDLEIADFNLASQIASVTALLGPQFRSKRVSLTTRIDPDVPTAVKGDPGRLRQILVNLVGNALKFTPANGEVEVVVTRDLRPGPLQPLSVQFAISDTGVGIAASVRHRLFQPFSQGDSSTTRQYGGTGLGLSICRQLVELMSGKIGVESRLGAGSCFWFTVPFESGNAGEHIPNAPAREMGEQRSAVRMRPEKLLLAEDNDVNALVAMRQLKLLGLRVRVVTNGREAVSAVERTPYDLILMDCHMPEMDGFEATRAIRALDPGARGRIPIVAMTANAQAEDQARCLAAGMDDYVSKPASMADLRAVLARWLPEGTE